MSEPESTQNENSSQDAGSSQDAESSQDAGSSQDAESPLDALFAQLRRLLEGTAGTGVTGQVQQVIEDFLAAFRLVPKSEFEGHLKSLSDLESQVDELARRVQALEKTDD